MSKESSGENKESLLLGRFRSGRAGQGQPAPQTRFYTIQEVADRLSVSTRTVRRWIADYELVTHYFGRSLRIGESDLNDFVGAEGQLTMATVVTQRQAISISYR